MGGGSLGRWLVRVGMRDRTHLGNEKRQHSQSCDAKFDAMRPFEQSQPLPHEHADASTVRVKKKSDKTELNQFNSLRRSARTLCRYADLGSISSRDLEFG